MASSQQMLQQATDSFSDEEGNLQAIIAQAVAGDANAKTNVLPAEIQTAQQLRATILAQVPDADTSGLDAIIANAQNVVSGGTAVAPAGSKAPGFISAQGVKVGPVLVPWIGVLAIAAFVGGAVYLSKGRGRGSRSWE